MTRSAGFMHRPSADRARYRPKIDTFPLGACRSRLIQALRHLGIVTERTAVKLREEQPPAWLRAKRFRAGERAREYAKAKRRARLERRADDWLGAQRRAQALEEECAASQAEQRRFALMLEEELAYETMTEEQKTARRREDQIVSWLIPDKHGA